MSGITTLQGSLRTARQSAAAAQRALVQNGGERARAERALAAATRTGDERAAAAARTKLEQLAKERAAQQAASTKAQDEISGLLLALDVPQDPGSLVEQLDAIFPIALLPVRIETRYFNAGQQNPELWVRIYPDDIHVDSHEPEITNQEEALGRAFWDATWHAGGDQSRERNAWSYLVNQLGPNRAAWIAKAMTPTNPQDKPSAPLPEDVLLAVAPECQIPGFKEASWTRAAVTRVLPHRWVAIGYRGGAKVLTKWSEPLPDTLPVGPSPDSPPPQDPGLPVDDGTRWMVDFNEAEKLGMGLRVALDPSEPLDLDALLVLGVKISADPKDGADLLADLLDAHHYTDGLAIAPQGTPTNNSSENSSGYTWKEPDPSMSFATERGDPLCTLYDATDGGRLTWMLGIERVGPGTDQVLAHVRNANGREYDDAGHMNSALWSATWGYFLDTMLDGLVTPEGLQRARRHFVDYVRGRGPLSALRIGRQPYGVLPAMSLDLWHANTFGHDPFEGTLLPYLKKLRTLFRAALPAVPRVGRTDDIDADLAQVLAMDATSLSYGVRDLSGKYFNMAAWSYLGAALPSGWWAALVAINQMALAAVGLPVTLPLTYSLYDPKQTELGRVLVQSGALSETEPLSPNYIEMLRTAGLKKLKQGDFDLGEASTSLLYVLLRHALLLGYTTSATKIAKDQNLIDPATPKEPELVDLDPAQPTSTVWKQLDLAVSVNGTSVTLGEVVTDPDLSVKFDTSVLKEIRSSLEYLSTRPTAVLERALTETLDLSTHRLDPWITSFAAARLDKLRESQAHGVYLGAYGYVEGLKPDVPRTPVPPPPDEEGSPIYASDEPAGFLHAPSLAHAAAAAVLRSGHLSHAGDLLAIDLSGQRVRLAQWILDGVRQGQSLGALLGYRFERHLHDQHLDIYILPFRERAPLVAKKLEHTHEPAESIAARNVVDGLRLQRMWKSGDLHFGSNGLPAASHPDHPKLIAALEQLDAVADATSDAVVAESVYQTLQGSPLRAGASLEALAAGDVPPPELEVTRTPRTGVGLTHRLVAFLRPDPAATEAWPADPAQVRAAAEPALNAWAARLLVHPSRVKAHVLYRDPSTQEVLAETDIALSSLGLCPLDVIHATDGEDMYGGGELAASFRYHAARNRPPEVPEGAAVELSLERRPEWALTELSLYELQPVVQAVRRLQAQARSLNANDLTMPNDTAPLTTDVAELDARAHALSEALGACSNALSAALASADATLEAKVEPAPGEVEALRAAIFALRHFGVRASVPIVPTGATRADLEMLAANGRVALDEVLARAKAHADLVASFAATAELAAQRDHQIARIQAILGEGFRVLPLFLAVVPPELESAFQAQEALLGDQPSAPLLWLGRVARVRDGASRFERAVRHAELLGCKERLELTVGQLPTGVGERWLGLPLGPGERPRGGRVSLVAQGVHGVDFYKPLCGVLLDEWTETIPNPTEVTGLVFQHDAPGARAPQAVLLAVPPGDSQYWSLSTLETTVLETLELAKLRAVDLDTLPLLGHYLPGLYFAFNIENETVSTSFLTLTAFKQQEP